MRKAYTVFISCASGGLVNLVEEVRANTPAQATEFVDPDGFIRDSLGCTISAFEDIGAQNVELSARGQGQNKPKSKKLQQK